MKITIEIDCTPQEAREAMGLPDVTPLQEQWLKRVEERMNSVELNNAMTDEFLKSWASGGTTGVEAMSRFFESFVNPAMKPPRE